MIYDAFQKRAISSTDNGNSVIVCAPTGAGKTAIAEYIIEKCIAENKGIVYTAPIKALSNQKFRDFSSKYGNNIGILTGDVSLNANAPILIMTTEIFRNTLLEDPERMNNISWVIFDEVHYIDDPERGTVWEESIIFCPEHMKILALSATIPNAIQLSAWIRKIHKHPIETIIEKKRPVPLHHCFQAQNRVLDDFEQLNKHIYSRMKKSHHKNRKHNSFRDFEHESKNVSSNKISSLIQHLQQNDKMPAIYFAFSRKRCEKLAFETRYFNFLNPKEKAELKSIFANLLKKYGLTEEPSAIRMRSLIENGVAYHHAGLLPSLKEVVEQLFTSRLIKLIFTTETFALGINMPARTVVFDELRKFYGQFFANLRTRDYYQMAGRAGRRGIDTEGFVYSRINPSRIDSDQIYKMIFSQPEPVISQFNLSYASLLHLYARWQDQLYEVYPQTLHFYQANKKSRKKALEILHIKIRLLKEMNYINNNTLTDKGKFASSIYGYELLLTELFFCGMLEELSSIDLNIVLTSLVFEPRKTQLNIKLPHQIIKIHKKLSPVVEDILKIEKRYKIRPLTKKPFFNLSEAIEKWSSNETLAVISTGTNADPGEIVRYFRMVIQILRQLRAIPFISNNFKQNISRSLEMINRDEVDAEKQLREGL
jgi:superfamily II RNA helicase